MKKGFIFTLTALAIISSAFGANSYIKKKVPVGNIYVPFGFDSNDLTEIVVEGVLPDLCFKAPEVYMMREGNNIKLKVVAYKDNTPQVACPRVRVPFNEVVNTGILDRGKYKLTANKNTKYETKSELKVSESVSGAVDDYIYARVEGIEFDGHKRVTLKGHNPSDCWELDKVEFADNGTDTYSVLPILKQVKADCKEVMTEFTYEADLPDTLERDKVLLHVRAMSGKSVNKLVTRK